jgi:hypothetical protein
MRRKLAKEYVQREIIGLKWIADDMDSKLKILRNRIADLEKGCGLKPNNQTK